LHRWNAPDGYAYFVALSPDNRLVALASPEGKPSVWDAASGRCLRQLVGHDGATTEAIFSPDGKLLATCGDDGNILVWDLSDLPR
jgi:WD40 repeat protein